MSRDKANNLIRGRNKQETLNLDFNFPSLMQIYAKRPINNNNHQSN